MSLATWNPPPRKSWLRPSDENQSTATFHLKVDYESAKFRKCNTNCRNIEIPLLYPGKNPNLAEYEVDNLRIGDDNLACQTIGNESSPMLTDTKVRLTTRATTTFQDPTPITNQKFSHEPTSRPPSSPLLTLPLELRLEIYSYLLPPQAHTIITQYPSNGLYYSSTPEHSTQSLYPPTSFHATTGPKLTTYTISHRETPIYTEILRVCKQTYEEAQSLLYGSKGVVFNFDTCLDAVLPFLQDRSIHARESIREIRVAVDIPKFALVDTSYADAIVKNVGATETAKKWEEICEVMMGLKALRIVNLVVRGSFGKKGDTLSLNSMSSTMDSTQVALFLMMIDNEHGGNSSSTSALSEESEKMYKNSNAEIREVEWVKELLKMDTLRNVGVTWQSFGALGEVD